MVFRITIHTFTQEPVGNAGVEEPPVKLYEQTVDTLDMKKIIDAVNAKPRIYTKRAKKGGEAS